MNRRTFIKKAAMLPVVGAMLATIAPAPYSTTILTVEYGELEGPLQIIPDHSHSISPFVIGQHTHAISSVSSRFQVPNTREWSWTNDLQYPEG